MARLKEVYKETVVPELKKEFNYKNIMQVPKLQKIIVNIGMGEAVQDAKTLDHSVEEMMDISGQRPVITKAKKSISNFKLRAGMQIGCKVTMRSNRMYEFFDRLVNIALPRIRDFRGISDKGFDGRGNYSLGIKEQIIFPEINYDKVAKVRGMGIVIVTSANTDEEGKALLRLLGVPFRKN